MANPESASQGRSRSLRGGALSLGLLGIAMCVAGAAPSESAPVNAWELWGEIYDVRGDRTITSGRLSYLRRLYVVSEQTGQERRFPVALESYTFQGDRYLIESTEFEDPGALPLDELDIDALVPSRTATYFWDGEELVSFTSSTGQDELVSVSESRARVPDFTSFGRAPNQMPSPEDWATSLRVMGKELTVAETDGGDQKLLILRSGLEHEAGYYMEVSVDPALDNAIVGSTTKLDGIVLIEETYRDFSAYDGLYVPREVRLTKFRIEPTGKTSSLASMEEFLLVGSAELNRQFSREELTRPVPEGVDRFEDREQAGEPSAPSER